MKALYRQSVRTPEYGARALLSFSAFPLVFPAEKRIFVKTKQKRRTHEERGTDLRTLRKSVYRHRIQDYLRTTGQPASKELLITLLNELLAGEHQIENLTLLDKENHSDSIADAGIIYDLYCLTTTGEYIIVEMQNRFHSNFLDRTLFYMCRAIGRQVENIREKRKKERELRTDEPMTEEENDLMLREEKADYYGARYKLSTVYGIFLMNFREPGLEAKFRTDTVIADRESGKTINPHFRQIYLQFPYFEKELNECETLYDKLIYTLKNMQHWNRMPDALKEQVFNRLEELAAVANLSMEDRIAYDKALDRYRVSRIVEEDARRAGWKQGLEEGREKGLEEGWQVGT